MIWLDICDKQGNALYFDIRHVERKRSGRRWRRAVAGICGNGLYEMDVLVEPDGGEVTFFDVDGMSSRDSLLAAIDTDRLEEGLLDAVGNHLDPLTDLIAIPHASHKQAFCICEQGAVWGRAV